MTTTRVDLHNCAPATAAWPVDGESSAPPPPPPLQLDAQSLRSIACWQGAASAVVQSCEAGRGCREAEGVSEQALAEGLQQLGYVLQPDEMRMLAEQVDPHSASGAISKSAFLASQIDWHREDYRQGRCAWIVDPVSRWVSWPAAWQWIPSFALVQRAVAGSRQKGVCRPGG